MIRSLFRYRSVPVALVAFVALNASFVTCALAVGDCDVSPIVRRAGGHDAHFGWSVSLSGGRIYVGAPDAKPRGGRGAVLVYEHADGVVTNVARLFAPGSTRTDRVGYSVAGDGARLIAGAPGTNVGGVSDVGAAHVFEEVDGRWVHVQRLVPSDMFENGIFGDSVDLDGDLAVVGATVASAVFPASGIAYVFERVGGTWTETARLLPAGLDFSSFFGSSVAICDQNTILVGASSHRFPSQPAAGAAWVFVRSGGTWVEQAMLSAADRAMSDNFGLDVDCVGDVAIVGSPLHDHGSFDNGAGYVFERTGTVWSQVQELLGSPPSAEDQLGFSVAINADLTIVLGGPGYAAITPTTGTAREFTETAGVWAETDEFVSPDSEVGDNFGRAVAIDVDNAVIGAPFQNNPDSGAAFLFWGPCP